MNHCFNIVLFFIINSGGSQSIIPKLYKVQDPHTKSFHKETKHFLATTAMYCGSWQGSYSGENYLHLPFTNATGVHNNICELRFEFVLILGLKFSSFSYPIKIQCFDLL